MDSFSGVLFCIVPKPLFADVNPENSFSGVLFCIVIFYVTDILDCYNLLFIE